MKTFFKLLTISFLINLGTLTAAIAQHHSASDKSENAGMLEIVATDFAFDAPGEIPSGWTTIEYINQGDEPHFLYVMRLPDDKTIDDYAVDLYGPVNEVWYALRDEGIDRSEALQRLTLPAWYRPSEYDRGGTGLIAPGRTVRLTIYLEPGTYILDCYMKSENGEIHGMEGMLREIVVTNERSEATRPEADINITLSNYEMNIDGDLTPGSHTVAVHSEDFGHTVHVARLEPDTDVDALVDWMSWYTADGLVAPAPAIFLGGMHRLPQGSTGYFTLDLEPGRYLFVSDYTAHRGVLKEVTVPPAEAHEANPEDVSSIDGIINAYYEVVSGPAGEPDDAERDRTLHHPDAWVAIAGKSDDGQPIVEVMTLDEFYGDNEPREEGFWEWETDRTVSRSGNMIHVWSSYAITRTEGGEPYDTGVNSITLFHDGTRYWIMGWMYDSAVE